MEKNLSIDITTLFENLKSAVLHINEDGEILYANNPCLTMFGYSREELYKKTILRLLALSHQREFHQKFLLPFIKLSEQKDKITKRNTILKAKHKNGRHFSVELMLLALWKDGKKTLLIIIDDLSFYESLQEMLQVSKDNYIALAENASEAIIQINKDFIIKYLNVAAEKVFGFNRAEIINKHVRILLPEGGFKQYKSIFNKQYYESANHRDTNQPPKNLEIIGQRKDKRLFPLEISFGSWIGSDEKKSLTFIMRDITTRKKTEKHLKHLAYHDKLTALGNRDLFDLYLREILEEMKHEKEKIASLLFLDLDGFKKINDTLGHTVGDTILIECSRRINQCLRTNDHIYRFSDALDMDRFTDLYRFGGDEFVILLPEIKKTTDAAIIAQRIIDTIKESFEVKGSDLLSRVTLGCSIGIALIPQDGKDINTLVRNADMAMYRAKEVGNSYMYYTDKMNQLAIENLMLEMEIRKALENKEFRMYYQPIVDKKGIVIGIEALIRWIHPDKGMILPANYLPFAEKYGFIDSIGDWVIKTSCKQISYWNNKYNLHLFVSINVSVKQFEHKDFVDSITGLIQNLKIPPKYIKLEITESHLMKNPEKTIDTINRLKELNRGLSIAIDDFGTGYSSLSYLSTLPVDIVKIDRSFIINIERLINQKIINTILMLAKGLDIDVIAEGVESKKAMEFLISRGVACFQGSYIRKAISVKEFASILEKGTLSLLPSKDHNITNARLF
jgi:PAS domain S-box-containing protein